MNSCYCTINSFYGGMNLGTGWHEFILGWHEFIILKDAYTDNNIFLLQLLLVIGSLSDQKMTEECDICKDEQLVRQVVARQFRKNCYKFDFFSFSILSKAWEFHFLGLWGSLAMWLPLSFSGSIIMINIIMMRDERSKVFKVLLFLDSRRCDQILTNSWSGWLSLIS